MYLAPCLLRTTPIQLVSVLFIAVLYIHCPYSNLKFLIFSYTCNISWTYKHMDLYNFIIILYSTDHKGVCVAHEKIT